MKKKQKISNNGKLRLSYTNKMKKLAAQKRKAWAEKNISASEEISAEIQNLLEKEAKLSSGIGVVIRS